LLKPVKISIKKKSNILFYFLKNFETYEELDTNNINP
jgi:hypothetical protein